MTTAKPFPATPPLPADFQLPDPPDNPEDKMTNFDQMAATGGAHHLRQHLGNLDTTLVAGERYVVIRPTRGMAGSHYPDLLVAFDVNPAAYKARNGYVIPEQGKPPDFVLEVASPNTAETDVTDKRVDYAALLIPEYWRFDETGEHHGTRLAGDRLVDGEYVAIDVEKLPDGSLQGYSGVLNLCIRWEDGQLEWIDPATGEHIATFDSERARADAERAGRLQERARADDAEARANVAEARVRQLEEQLRQQDR